ncbi:MAG TPA: branched-chain amino acid ABC transporter substrate-binding protein [Solirubrobacteraceae bacterium]|jgi:branched-chain amino acid transport system substrate-binding protein|nr:branched-chain amino acid ABC transporter substrate-binding protein [Solirubrobacteraceae bacterium]
MAVGALAGCGGVGSSPAAERVGTQLTVYSGLPLQGPAGASSMQILGGEKLALADAQGRVGRFTVNFVSLDDSNTTTGNWDPDVTAANAKAVAQDPTTIAYIGDYDSGATAISLPLVNGAAIPQVSPASAYVGLTSSLDAGQDEPERFYPSGRRTFARIAPGDTVQASAQVSALQARGVRRVFVLSDQDPFDAPLAQIVAGRARSAGIEVVGLDMLSIAAGTSFAGEVAKIVRSGAQAVFLSANATSQAAQLFVDLHTALPRLRLLACGAMLSPAFTGALGSAEAVTTVGSPVLPSGMYPAAAARIYAQYRRQFGEAADPYALYGYEAMSVVLAAIRAAGSHGDERTAVTAKLLSTHDRRSVLGTYSIDANGDTTLATYALDRIAHGLPVFWRAFNGR